MDASKYAGNNVTIDALNASITKHIVLLNSGVERLFPDGKTKLSFTVELDNKQLEYIPNKKSLNAIIAKYGTETTRWIGKTLQLRLEDIKGKQGIVAYPL